MGTADALVVERELRSSTSSAASAASTMHDRSGQEPRSSVPSQARSAGRARSSHLMEARLDLRRPGSSRSSQRQHVRSLSAAAAKSGCMSIACSSGSGAWLAPSGCASRGFSSEYLPFFLGPSRNRRIAGDLLARPRPVGHRSALRRCSVVKLTVPDRAIKRHAEQGVLVVAGLRSHQPDRIVSTTAWHLTGWPGRS